MHEWADGSADDKMEGQNVRCMDGLTDGQMDGETNRQSDRWMTEKMNE